VADRTSDLQTDTQRQTACDNQTDMQPDTAIHSSTTQYTEHVNTSRVGRFLTKLGPNLQNFVKCTYENVTREL